MAYTTIDDPSEYFTTTLYVGNQTDRSITNSANAGNFQPDWLWIKVRNNANNHRWFDSNRGHGEDLKSNLTEGGEDSTDRCTGFDSNGFSLGVNAEVNSNTHNITAWQWKVNAGTKANNTAGNITANVQLNAEAGISIGTYTGNGSDQQTVGTGLGDLTNSLILVKRRNAASNWAVGGGTNIVGTGGSRYLQLNTATAAQGGGENSGENQNGTVNLSGYSSGAASGLFQVNLNGTDGVDVNANNSTYIFYALKSIQGYSKVGKYTGSGTTDGAFVYTGFKPAWVMIKRTGGTENWVIWDNQRDPFNNFYHVLLANAASVEDTSNAGSSGRYVGDFLSNGFKLRNTHATSNASSTYIYMAFAEHPFVSSEGTPVTAR